MRDNSLDSDKMTALEAITALQWLCDMGADEIISDLPVDHYQLAKQEATQPKFAPSSPPIITRSDLLAAPDAQKLAQSCQNLREIKEALENYDICPLKKMATNLCAYDGNPQAQTMLIGEAPGRDEDLEGRPFVGRSGKLLDKMLSAIGIGRQASNPQEAVFISNTVFWRPPGNRAPTEIEALMCLPFLLRMIELVSPKFILCLGAVPAQKLTGSREGILKMRGRWLNFSHNGRNIPLLPTLHPAYLLRQPLQKRLSWRDLLNLKERLDGA